MQNIMQATIDRIIDPSPLLLDVTALTALENSIPPPDSRREMQTRRQMYRTVRNTPVFWPKGGGTNFPEQVHVHIGAHPLEFIDSSGLGKFDPTPRFRKSDANPSAIPSNCSECISLWTKARRN